MRIMKVKQKSVDFDANGTQSLRCVMGNRFKKNGYTHVKVNGKVYVGSVVSNIVWLD